MQKCGFRESVEQGIGGGAIGDLSAGQQESDGATKGVGQGMDFRRPTTPRATNRLRPFPPFSPLARPIDRWRIDSTTPRFQHMNDTADHPAIINPRFPPCILGKIELKPRKLLCRQPEMCVAHSKPPSPGFES
jgi:hypothetical protein